MEALLKMLFFAIKNIIIPFIRPAEVTKAEIEDLKLQLFTKDSGFFCGHCHQLHNQASKVSVINLIYWGKYLYINCACKCGAGFRVDLEQE